MPRPKWNANSSPCGAIIAKLGDGALSVGNSTSRAVPIRTYGLWRSLDIRARPSVSDPSEIRMPPIAPQSYAGDSRLGRYEYAGCGAMPRSLSPRTQASSPALLNVALLIERKNRIAQAASVTTPMPNSPHVAAEILPLRGSMQCFTPTTESPIIAATSMARAPL